MTPGPRRRGAAIAAVLLFVLLVAGCGSDKVADYEFTAYVPEAGSTEYDVRIGVSGSVGLGVLSTLLGSGDGETGLDIALTGDALGTVVQQTDGFRYTLEVVDVDGELPFGGRFPQHPEKFVTEFGSKGDVLSTDGEGLLGLVPATMKGIGWACPELPDQSVRAGDTWQGEARVVWGDESTTVRQENTWVEVDVDGTQTARMSASADAPFTRTMDLAPIAELLGINSSLLSGLRATLRGTLRGTATCDLTIPDQRLVQTSSHHDLEITISLSGGTGNLAALVGELTLRASVDESMTPKLAT